MASVLVQDQPVRIRAMWPICLTRRKRPSSSKKLLPLRQLISNRRSQQSVIDGGQNGTYANHRPDGAFGAYIARPTACQPPLSLFCKSWGQRRHPGKTCDELAEVQGRCASPDLFWRQEAGVDLSVTSESDWQHGLRLYQAYDRDAGVWDVKGTANTVANLPECRRQGCWGTWLLPRRANDLPDGVTLRR